MGRGNGELLLNVYRVSCTEFPFEMIKSYRNVYGLLWWYRG